MARFFAVRNKVDPELFASNEGWLHFQRSTIFEFRSDALIAGFLRGLEGNAEMVEITFVPVHEVN